MKGESMLLLSPRHSVAHCLSPRFPATLLWRAVAFAVSPLKYQPYPVRTFIDRLTSSDWGSSLLQDWYICQIQKPFHSTSVPMKWPKCWSLRKIYFIFGGFILYIRYIKISQNWKAVNIHLNAHKNFGEKSCHKIVESMDFWRGKVVVLAVTKSTSFGQMSAGWDLSWPRFD